MTVSQQSSLWTTTTSTNPKSSLGPFARKPVTGRYGDAYHAAAQHNTDARILTQAQSLVDPELSTNSTYGEFAESVDRLTAALYSAGVRPWDPVVIAKRNHPDVQLLGMAVARLGAVPVQLAWTHGREVLDAILARCGEPWFIADSDVLDNADYTHSDLDGKVRRLLMVGTEDEVDADRRGDWLGSYLGTGGAAPVRMREWSEPMVVTHTSGTTGIPKLVMHSAESIYAMTHLETERWFGYGLGHRDTAAICDPFFHHRYLTGVLALATTTPTTLFLTDSEDIEAISTMMRGNKPTFVETLPNMFLRWEHTLLPQHADIFGRTRVYLNSFDAIHTRTVRAFLAATEHRAPVWVQSWSQSENGPLVVRPYRRRSVRRRGQLPTPTQQLGWPIPTYARMRCVDPVTRKRQPAGVPGLIEIKGPGRCIGYLGEQERHDAKVDGPWWNTGDIGSLGRTGNVTLYDREIDSIPGASCIQLEDVLLDRLPELSEVVVLAPREGSPLPVYSTRGGEPVDPTRWCEAVADLPSDLTSPVHILWDEFPRTATWKIQRPQLLSRLTGHKPRGTGQWT